MAYRLKVILLSAGVVLGFGSSFHRIAKRCAHITPETPCVERTIFGAPAATPEKPRQP